MRLSHLWVRLYAGKVWDVEVLHRCFIRERKHSIVKREARGDMGVLMQT